MENITTNTNDKNRNTINKKRNTTNEKIIKIKTTPEENTLADNEHQTRMTTQTDATVRGLLPEEKQAQEIIDAIKTHCGLDLKDKQKWKRQIGQIAEVQNELHRHSKDFVNCVKTLIQNPYYKEISLNLVLKKIRLMPIQLEQLQNENNTENIGYSEDEVFTALFEQNAKAYGTTPEYERAKDELEQKFIHSVMDSGRHRPTDAERVEHKEDLKKLKQNMLGNYKTA